MPRVSCGAGDVCAHGVQGIAQLRIRYPVDQRLPGGWRVESEDHAHGGGFAGPVGSEESGDLSRCDLNAQFIDSTGGAVVFGQCFQGDHGVLLWVLFQP